VHLISVQYECVLSIIVQNKKHFNRRRRKVISDDVDPALEELWRVVNHLNLPDPSLPPINEMLPPGKERWDGPLVRAELRRLVGIWQRSGPNLKKMLQQQRELHKKMLGWKILLIPTDEGNAVLRPFPMSPERGESFPTNLAVSSFMTLTTNPYWEMLGGPCARCDDFYIKRIKNQKVYCGRRCSGLATAVPATKRRRDNERAIKIKNARAAIHDWEISPKGKGAWKKWVASKTDLTDRWLTRAVNRKDLKAPKKP
jgi:hypothetical protein